MADSKISDLTAASSLAGTDEFAISDGTSTSKAVTGQQISEYVETRYQQGVVCTHSSDTTITTATWTPLSFDTESWKVGDSDIHSTVTNNGRLTAQIAGEYLPYGVISWASVAATFSVAVRVRINGTGQWSMLRVPYSTGVVNNVALPSVPVQLSVNDYIIVEVRHERGSNLDVLSADTKFGMYLIGR